MSLPPWMFLSSTYLENGRTHANNNLRKHAKSHSKPVHCPESGCSYSCATEKELRRHQNSRHKGTEEMMREVCPVKGCRITFSRRDNLLRHLRVFHKKSNDVGDGAEGRDQ